jgi:hypothetical protein
MGAISDRKDQKKAFYDPNRILNHATNSFQANYVVTPRIQDAKA